MIVSEKVDYIYIYIKSKVFPPGTSIQQYMYCILTMFSVIPVTLQVVMLIFETLRYHNKQVKKVC